MRKNVAIVALFGLLAITLPGCGGPSQAVGQQPAPKASEATPVPQADVKKVADAKTNAQAPKEADANCPVSPITTDRPENDNTAAWSRTWYRSPDGKIWASEPGLRTFRPEGDKVLWVKPAGTILRAKARRLDGEAPPFEVIMPSGYETFDYQASGVTFPTPGCWEIGASAGDSAWRFIVYIAPNE